nr:HEXXH motif domain-containing protein [Micromonospora sp. DSM 115978]
MLDDVDPYRHVVHTALPAPLPAGELDRWQALFDGAWSLLVRHHPKQARAVAAVHRVVVPTAKAERFRPRSASSGDGFGSVLLSEP